MNVVERRHTRSLIFYVTSSVLAFAGSGCAPKKGESTIEIRGSGSGGANGNEHADGSAGASRETAGAAGALITTPPETREAGKTDVPCGEVSLSAEQVVVKKTVPVTVKTETKAPVALYLMLDRSGSMDETPPGAQLKKWDQAVGSINAFAVDQQSDGLDVALDFFPKSSGQCNGGGYDTPAVPLGRLLDAAQAQSIATSLVTNKPSGGGGGGTPLEGGLRGAINYCLAFQGQNPGEQCVAVLVTDGSPNGCNEDAATLAQFAADAYARTPPVLTFAIGMDGADFGLLNRIAIAGGTDCSPGAAGNEACNIAANSGTSFSDALDLIRKTVTKTETHYETVEQVQTTKLACEYSIPPPPDGKRFDPERVNVRFTSDAGTEDIFQVPSLDDCSSTRAHAWYYDDPTKPKKILVCPDTCRLLQSSADAGEVSPDAGFEAPRVDVVLGCISRTAPPA